MKKNTRDWLISIFICLSLVFIIVLNKDFLLSEYDKYTIAQAKEYVRQGDGVVVFEHVGDVDQRGHYKAVKMHQDCFNRDRDAKVENTWLKKKNCIFYEYGFNGFEKLWDVQYYVDNFNFRAPIKNPTDYQKHLLLVGGSYTKGATTEDKNTFLAQFRELNDNVFYYAIAEGFWSPTNVLDYITNVNSIDKIIDPKSSGNLYYLFISHHVNRVCPDEEMVDYSKGKTTHYEIEDDILVRKGFLNNENSKDFIEKYSFKSNIDNCLNLFVKILLKIKKNYINDTDRSFKFIFLQDETDFFKTELYTKFKNVLKLNDIPFDSIYLDDSRFSDYFWKNDPHYTPHAYKLVGQKLIDIYLEEH